MTEQVAETPPFLAIIGTFVEDTETIRPSCGPQHAELEPGKVIVVVPRQVVLDAVRALRTKYSGPQ